MHRCVVGTVGITNACLGIFIIAPHKHISLQSQGSTYLVTCCDGNDFILTAGIAEVDVAGGLLTLEYAYGSISVSACVVTQFIIAVITPCIHSAAGGQG